MSASEKWIAGGTIDVNAGTNEVPKTYKVGKVPNEDSQMSFGRYIQTHWTTPEEQPSLMDTTYAYCATDGNFCVNTGVLWNCGNSSPSFNRYKRYDLTSTVQNAIGFGRFYPDKTTYANIGIYGGSGASTYKDDASNTPLTNYLNGKHALNTDYQSQVYGRNLTPFIEGFTLKDVVYVPIIMSYVLLGSDDKPDPTINPATANKAQMQKLRYRLSSIDAFENKEYIENPYIMGLYMQPFLVKTDDTTKTVTTGLVNTITPFCNGEYSITTTVYNEAGQQKEQEITYYPLYGDNQPDESTLDGWYAWYPEESDPTKRSKWISHTSGMHPLCIMGYGADKSQWKLPLIRLDGTGNNASSGKLLLTGNWIKTDILQVSNSERWMKIYSDKITEANVHDFCEYIRRQAAYFGGFFRCDGRLDLLDYRFIDEDTYMGVIDGSGITHGDYTRGLDNSKNPAFNWEDAVNNTPYVPGGGGDKDPSSGGDKDRQKSKYSGKKFTTSSGSIGEFGVKRYIINATNFEKFNQYINECLDYDAAREKFVNDLVSKGVAQDLALELWTDRFKDEASYTAAIFNKLGYGSDPRNSIISLMYFPLLGEDQFTDTGDWYIGNGYYIGKSFTAKIPSGAGTFHDVTYAPQSDFDPTDPASGLAVNYPVFTYESFPLVTNHEIKHPMGWDDFRAYEPYSRAELYIPYHGTIALNLNDVMDKSLSIDFCYDIITGASIATIFIDGSIYSTVPGQMGYNIPFSVDASSTTASGLMTLSSQSQSTKLNAVGNIVNGAMSIASGVGSGNYLGAAGALANTIIGSKQNQIQEKAIDYEIQHACDGRIVCNASASLVNLSQDDVPQIIWHYPNMLKYNDDNYRHTVGYATSRSGAVRDFTGYTVFTNVDLSAVSATEQEKAMILAQLQNGIII